MSSATHRNKIGDITNSRIERIEQKINYSAELSEDIQSAIVSMSKLLAEDVEWKREQRLQMRRLTLADEQKTYSAKLFGRLQYFAAVPFVWFIMNLWQILLSPFITLIRHGMSPFDAFMNISSITQQTDTLFMQQTIITVAAVFLMVALIYKLSGVLARRKYRPLFDELR